MLNRTNESKSLWFNWINNLHTSTNPLRERSVRNCTNLTSVGGVVQSPNFPGDYGNNYLRCEVSITAPAEWMIQLNFTTFNVESGSAKLYVRKRDRNFSVRCSDSNFIWHSQVNDGVTIISAASDNTLVPATTKEMVILFYFIRSNKTSSATYNWRATFSVTVLIRMYNSSDICFPFHTFYFLTLTERREFLLCLLSIR